MSTIAIHATETNWMSAYRAVNLLSREGRTPLWATRPFTGLSAAGQQTSFEAGTIVLEAGQTPGIEALRSRLGVDAVELGRLDGFTGLPIRPVRIAVYGGGGAPYNHGAAYGELGFLVDFIFPADILAGALADYDVLAVPGGGSRAMIGQLDPLGDAGCRAIADFVREGGMYLGCCAGAFDASLVDAGFLQICPQQQHLQMINAAVWNSGDEWLGLQSPGVGVLRAKVSAEHPVTFGMPSEIAITHYNGPLYTLRQDAVRNASDAVGLLSVVGTETDFTPAERFLDRNAEDGDLLVSRAIELGAFNAVAGEFGKGRVVLFGSHPEMGLSLDLDQWSGPARMLANAAFWQSSAGGARRSDRAPQDVGASAASASAGLKTAAARLDTVVEAAEALLQRDMSGVSWLDDALAMSTFGASGAEIWQRCLAGFRPAADGMRVMLGEIEARLAEATAMLNRVDVATVLGAAIEDLDQAINYRTPAEWNIDLGYEGLLQHLDRAEAMLRKAYANFGKSFPADSNPYAHLGESPFQLAAGSYLSAAGVFANCTLLLRLQNTRLQSAILLAAPKAGAMH